MKTIQKNFRIDETANKQLTWVAIDCGMGEAEVLRALISKAYRDETTRALIKKYRDLERMRKAGIDPTSYNVRTDNGVKNAPGQTSAPSNESGTSSITEARLDYNAWKELWESTKDIPEPKRTTDIISKTGLNAHHYYLRCYEEEQQRRFEEEYED